MWFDLCFKRLSTALEARGRVCKGRNRETPYWSVTDDGDLVPAVEMVKVVRIWLHLEGRAERIG